MRNYSMSDYSGKKVLTFWSRSLNPIEYPTRSEIISLEDIIDKDMTITVRARNGNLPEPLTVKIKQIKCVQLPNDYMNVLPPILL